MPFSFPLKVLVTQSRMISKKRARIVAIRTWKVKKRPHLSIPEMAPVIRATPKSAGNAVVKPSPFKKISDLVCRLEFFVCLAIFVYILASSEMLYPLFCVRSFPPQAFRLSLNVSRFIQKKQCGASTYLLINTFIAKSCRLRKSHRNFSWHDYCS